MTPTPSILNSIKNLASEAGDKLQQAGQSVADTVGSGDLKGLASRGLDSATNFVKDPANLPMLVGGAGALAGGLMTGDRRKAYGESRTGHLGRVLRNALLTGGLAGGGALALRSAVNNTVGAVDMEHPITGSDQNVSPVVQTAERATSSPLAGAASATGALALTRNWKGLGSAGPRDAMRKGLLSRMVDHGYMNKSDTPEVLGAVPGAKMRDFAKTFVDSGGPNSGIKDQELKSLFRQSGMVDPRTTGLNKIWQAVSRNPVANEMIGTTPGRAAIRGGMATGAYYLPALLNHFLPHPAPIDPDR